MDAAGALLRRWIGRETGGVPTLALADTLWFFGAVTGVAASLAIIDKIPESHRDLWEFLASLGFVAAAALAGWLLIRYGWPLPGGLAAGVAAAIVPAAGYGFTQLVHAYPRRASFDPFADFSGAIFGIALATVVAALLAYVLTRVTFNLFLAVGATHFAAQALATSWHASGDGRATTGLVVGGAMVLLGLFLDAAGRRREGFWMYLGGLAAIAVALAFLSFVSHHAGVWIAMLAIGALLLLFFVPLGRRTWVVFGAAGAAGAFAASQLSADGRTGRAIVIGGVLVLLGLVHDTAGRRLEGFWMHLGGLAAIAEGLVYSAVKSPDAEPWIPMLAIGAVLLLLFAPLERRTWAVFGAAGVGGAFATSGLASGDGRAARELVVGGVLVVLGLILDVRGRSRVAFWMHLGGLAGITAALGYLSFASTDPEARGWMPMLVVGSLLLLISGLLERRTWAVFGAANLGGAFGHYLETKPGWFAYVLLGIAVAAFVVGLLVHRARTQAASLGPPP